MKLKLCVYIHSQQDILSFRFSPLAVADFTQ